MKYIKPKRLLKNVILYFFIALLLLVVIFPFFWMMVTGLKSSKEIYVYPPSFLPKDFSLQTFRNVFQNKPIFLWLRNSLIVSISVTIISLIISVFSSYSFSRFRFYGRGLYSIVILTTQMLPTTLFIIPIFIIFIKLKLADSLLGLIVAYTTFSLPLCIWLLKGYFDSIPKEIDEAALVDGCTRNNVLFKIILPLSLPGLVATGVYSFIVAWNELLIGSVLLKSPHNWVMSYGLTSFMGEFNVQWNELMAASVVFAIPSVLLFLYFQKGLVGGMTAGSIKQ